MKHDSRIALSFDIEDWFCVKNMQSTLPFADWNRQEYRARIGLDFILNTLAKKNVKATFFILGWLAEMDPQIVGDIAREGHEIGTHGYSHTPVTQLTPASFEADLKKSLTILRKLSPTPIEGFRAPSFSITKNTLWALPILKANGLSYDSSIFPTYHPDYGIPGFKSGIQEIDGLTEVPLTVVKFGPIPVPVSGGGYFRLLPYGVFKQLLKAACKNAEKNTSDVPVLYFHPWEFDAAQPKVKLPALKSFRHYHGLKNNRQKFEALVSDFSLCTLREKILNESYHANQKRN